MNKQIPPEIIKYLESLLEEAGKSSSDESAQADLVNKLYEELDNYIAIVIGAKLPAEHLNEFSKLNQENKSPEEIEKFLLEKLPNAKEVFSKAFLDFKNKYLGDQNDQKSFA